MLFLPNQADLRNFKTIFKYRFYYFLLKWYISSHTNEKDNIQKYKVY